MHEFEKRAEQRVIINVDLYVPLDVSTPKADELDEVVDYDFIRRTVATRLSKGHIHLQETLCDDILTQVLAHPKVQAARVSTAKPDVYPGLRGGRRRSLQEQVAPRPSSDCTACSSAADAACASASRTTKAREGSSRPSSTHA